MTDPRKLGSLWQEERTLLRVEGLVGGIWSIAANHLLILAHANAFALDNLDVLQATQDLVLHLELGRHVELGALLNLERLLLQRSFGALLGQVDGDRRSALGLHGEGEDDAVSRVVGVGDRGAPRGETQGGFVSLQGLVFGIWTERC